MNEILSRCGFRCDLCPAYAPKKMRSRVDAAASIREKFPDMPERDYDLLIRAFEGRQNLLQLRKG